MYLNIRELIHYTARSNNQLFISLCPHMLLSNHYPSVTLTHSGQRYFVIARKSPLTAREKASRNENGKTYLSDPSLFKCISILQGKKASSIQRARNGDLSVDNF